MSKWFTVSLTALAVLLIPSAAGWAGEQTRLAAAERTGTRAFAPASAGKVSKPALELEVAAELGVIDAQLKLARMYQAGKDVPRSHARAFRLYQRIVDENADVRPYNARASSVARAFVALGNYYRTGIQGSTVKVNKRRAANLMWHAAGYLGDAEAQYTLAQMYLDGEGVPRNGRLAVNWLTNAAKKRHGKAQAMLGRLLWRGSRDVRRRPVKGLAFLSLARQNARNKKEARWIDNLYASAYSDSQPREREQAAKIALRWQARMGRKSVIVSVPEVADAGLVTPGKNEADALSISGAAAVFINAGIGDTSGLR